MSAAALALDPTPSRRSATGTVRTLDDAMRRIGAINLDMVKRKLTDAEEGLGWLPEQADQVEGRYRRFLAMLYLAGDASIVPTKDIDQFWHAHILDTRAYARDCRAVFGAFMHHFPYFGMRGEADARNLAASFDATAARYAELFGEEYCARDAGAQAEKCSKCGKGYCHHPPQCR